MAVRTQSHDEKHCYVALRRGYVLAQTIVLAFLAAIIFGTVISLSYRFLNWILD
jgi:hypothetical protein